MQKVIGLGVAGFLAIAAGSPVFAADIPVKAVYKAPVVVVDPWTGFYVGLNAGYSWGPWDSTSIANNFFDGVGFTNTASPKVNGFLGGVQAGYNWQWNNWVFGLEADFQFTGERATNDGTAVILNLVTADSRFIGTQTVANEWKLDWFSTLRLRGGLLIDPSWLVYVTGGLAIGRAEYSNTTSVTITRTTLAGAVLATATATVGASEARTEVGWTIGLGTEKKLTTNWTVKLEYLYMDLGTRTFLGGTGLDTSVALRDHIARIGINYQFH